MRLRSTVLSLSTANMRLDSKSAPAVASALDGLVRKTSAVVVATPLVRTLLLLLFHGAAAALVGPPALACWLRDQHKRPYVANVVETLAVVETSRVYVIVPKGLLKKRRK